VVVPGLTGGYYWLPTPGDGSPSWHVVTCHRLGSDAEAGHVEMRDAVIDRLAAAWGKDVTALGRLLRDRPYGFPRGWVTRPGRRFLILYGGDSPRPDWLEPVLLAFALEHRDVRMLYDEHERMLDDDRIDVAKVLDIRLPADQE
jgi:hypothetical protein